MLKDHVLFFDLDRTLWDFDANSKVALETIYGEQELQSKLEVSFNEFHQQYMLYNEQCWKAYREGKMSKEILRFQRFLLSLEHFGYGNKKLSQQMGERYVEISPYQTRLIPGTMDLLSRCQALGYEMHVITNGFEEIQDIKLDNSGIRDFFGHIITSEGIGERKPHPIVFEHALQLTNSSAEESVMIGDDFEADIVGAKQAGWKQVYYNPHGHEVQENITLQINSLDELIPFI